MTKRKPKREFIPGQSSGKQERRPPWLDSDKVTLRQHWSDGTSTSKIGTLMGRSKNAIVGQAHRDHLPSRPSPIILGREPRSARVPRAPKATLPSFAIAPTPEPLPPPEPLSLPRFGSNPSDPKYVAPASVKAPGKMPIPHSRQCTWLEGGVKPWVQCEMAVTLDKDGHPVGSWCGEHRKVVYVKQQPAAL